MTGVLAEVRRQGHRVGIEVAEQAGRVPFRGRADVPALGVEDAERTGRHVPSHPLERRPALGAERLEEGDVDLHCHRVIGGGLDDAPREGFHSGHARRQVVGQLVRVRVDAQAERGSERLASSAEPLERRSHPARASSTGTIRRASSGLAAASA